jgi:ankyrin repeat protein
MSSPVFYVFPPNGFMSTRRALFRALSKSDLNMLRALRGRGISLAYEPEDAAPAFNVALAEDFVDIAVLDWLDAEGVDPAMRDRDQWVGPLHMAVGRADPAAFAWLLRQGLDLNAQTRTGETALMLCARPPEDVPEHWAAENWREYALRDARELLAAGADPNLADEAGRTALDSACETGDADMVSLLLMTGARADCADADGVTPLHLAAVNGSEACLRALIEAGVQVDAKNINGATPLHSLAELSVTETTPAHLKAASLLMAAGGNLSVIDAAGRTPFTLAVRTGNVPMAAIMVAGGAMGVSNRGDALRDAVMFEDADMTGLLIRAGADVNMELDGDESRALHIAAHEGFTAGVKALLDHGADIEAVNGDGETALLIAVRRQKFAVVEQLILRGANTAHTDAYGNTALSLAQRRKNAGILRLLDGAQSLPQVRAL